MHSLRLLLPTSASSLRTLGTSNALLLDKRGSVLTVLSETLRLTLLKKTSNTSEELLLFLSRLRTQLLDFSSVLLSSFLDEIFKVRHNMSFH